MTLSEFDILNKLMQAGVPLRATHLGGSSSTSKEFRSKMCDSGLIKLNGKTFAITSEGKEFWQKSATPEQIEEANRRTEERFQQDQRDFLTLVRRKKGKLTTKDLRNVSEEVLVGSINQDLVRREGLFGPFEILPKGEAFLLADQPLDKQLNILRDSHQNLVEKLRDTQKEITNELETLQSGAKESFQPEIIHLEEKIRGTEATFDTLLHELSGLTRLLAAGNKFKKALIDQATELLQEIRENREKTSELAYRTSQALKEQQTKLEDFDKQISAQLTAFDRQLIEKLLVASSPTTPMEPPPTSTPMVIDRIKTGDQEDLPETRTSAESMEVDQHPEKTGQRQLVDQI